MEATLWRPGEDIIISRKICLDTETELIKDHTPPPVVIMQVYGGGDKVHIVKWMDIPRYLNQLETWNSESEFIFHNCAFDIPVLGYPNFLIKAIEDGRVRDTMLRYALYCIHEKGDIFSISLKSACKDLLDIEIDKNEDIRLTFSRSKELSGEHVDYAAMDPVYTFLLNEAIPPEKTATEDIQVKAAIALDAISRRGFLVDEVRRKEMEEVMNTRVEDSRQVMADNGYIPGQSGNKKVLHKLVQGYVDQLGIKDYPKTKKSGVISTSEDALTKFEGHEIPFLKAYKNHEYYNKIVKNYLAKENIGSDGRVHTRFKTILMTGRTSSSDPNIQNLPREDGVRGIYIPAEDSYLCSIDYSQLELCSLAQHCLVKHGKSVLADVINSGKDVHKYLASLIWNIPEADVTKRMRQAAKAASFGYPGGLAARTFIGYAKGYGVDIDEKESQGIRDAWLKAFPEMEKHLQPDFDSENDWYLAKTITGRLRSHCSYTEAANTVFQGLAADGGKLMLWECFLKKVPNVNFVHDEILFEVKKDTPAKMTEQIAAVENIMVTEMARVLPDIKVRTEATLTNRWMKCDGERDKDGNLVVLTEEYLKTKGGK